MPNILFKAISLDVKVTAKTPLHKARKQTHCRSRSEHHVRGKVCDPCVDVTKAVGSGTVGQ